MYVCCVCMYVCMVAGWLCIKQAVLGSIPGDNQILLILKPVKERMSKR